MNLKMTALVTGLLLWGLDAHAANEEKIAEEVMKMAKAQWQAEMESKPLEEIMTDVADEYTEFNPDVPVLMEGKTVSGRMYEAYVKDGSKLLAAEMLNPNVQVYGDVAVLTYNFAGIVQDKEGKTSTTLAKSTRIYAKKDKAWKLVHANFAPVNSNTN